MTALDNVTKLISRLSPEPVCDDCISRTLDLSALQRADHNTRELAGSNGFAPRKDACSPCGETKLVNAYH
ncbi:hypothetical protein [Novosphingobium endophyticum]|uniref:hypothetical protein n=1 Tax=Novosphingobium endophyticum TaxID=1955250 RepID=UPI00166B3FF2|nr:hypothetical protein [Novosphingobium endophyticum]